MTSSFLIELKEDCHTCMDGFNMHDLLPSVLFHSSCHKDKTAQKHNKRRRKHQSQKLNQKPGACAKQLL
jgi:hypothetical protein